MRWSNLAFLHWPVEAARLRRLVPAALEFDTFGGQAWLGIVPFRMEAVRLRLCPPVPGAHVFPELNVRTYVRHGERTGVWFFSLDAGSRLAVRGARFVYNLPYFDASMSMTPEGKGVAYASERVHDGAPSARLRAAYGPASEIYHAESGSLDHFLVERYCLFTRSRSGEMGFIDVHHLPWPLQRAAARLEVNTMAVAAGVALPEQQPLVHFAHALEVVAWNRRPLKKT